MVAGAGLAIGRYALGPSSSGSQPAVGTVPVQRTTIEAHEIVGGVLGYLGRLALVAPGSGGVVTWLPNTGTVVAAGERLYEVDGRPVVAWAGDRPTWRDIAAGMTDGPDVAEAEQNLVDLGYAAAAELTVDDHFTSATATAIRRWQSALGVPQTGGIALGTVVFLATPARVAEVAAALGAPLQPGSPIMSVTSTARVVTVHLDVTRVGALRVGDPVTIAVAAGGTPLDGHVTDVGAPVSPSEGGAAQAPVSIGLDAPDAAAGIPDSAPVQVTITTARRDNVLVVPIDALLAAPGGGYQVVLVDDDGRHQIRVTTGLFDETGGRVEVTGDGIVAGALVEVPAT
jgi:peptidoglycan hydrolase-like protein with peptidoglycan-binding domain